jgi:hypothetical protein
LVVIFAFDQCSCFVMITERFDDNSVFELNQQ